MLTAIPKSWLSWNYEFLESDKRLASLTIEWLGERGTLDCGGQLWELSRDGWYHGTFSIRQAGRKRASAEKPSALFRSFQVTFDDEDFCWEAESPLTRSFVLRKGNKVIGSMRPDTAFTRRATIDLPEELPLERKLFLAWLTLLMWRRAHNSS